MGQIRTAHRHDALERHDIEAVAALAPVLDINIVVFGYEIVGRRRRYNYHIHLGMSGYELGQSRNNHCVAKLGAECTDRRSLLPRPVRSPVAALMRAKAALTSQ